MRIRRREVFGRGPRPIDGALSGERTGWRARAHEPNAVDVVVGVEEIGQFGSRIVAIDRAAYSQDDQALDRRFCRGERNDECHAGVAGLLEVAHPLEAGSSEATAGERVGTDGQRLANEHRCSRTYRCRSGVGPGVCDESIWQDGGARSAGPGRRTPAVRRLLSGLSQVRGTARTGSTDQLHPRVDPWLVVAGRVHTTGEVILPLGLCRCQLWLVAVQVGFVGKDANQKSG